MSYSNILITGANRGIGLELVVQYASMDSTKKLFVTYRDEKTATKLLQLAESNKKIRLIKLDVKDYDNYGKVVDQLTEELARDGLDLLINNAGICLREELDSVTREAMLENFEVNVVSPLLLTRALIPILQVSGKAGRKTFIANISSKVGSIADNSSGRIYPYRISKTALNQVSKSLSVELKDKNIIVAAIHPGWVLTDMGGPNALIDTYTSVSNMIRTFENVSLDQTGLFLNYNGTVIPY